MQENNMSCLSFKVKLRLTISTRNKRKKPKKARYEKYRSLIWLTNCKLMVEICVFDSSDFHSKLKMVINEV